ncbi:ATP synthase subunit O, mitochondrial [Auxenochlorella protothecoides]|uniref:ATP synthase subunit O, mitochondrial n=1 Tax=Auxenochlorella protothecoides TaxID=3075 RepID=A0A087SEF0_AUXPR|nr:ATP synthase subunit O, mitochondrial [Auxenochlorella protothecoides]KFM24104.1 ATP synthase subunit O, mitochondrial [Auxenochlorella protothecoides]
MAAPSPTPQGLRCSSEASAAELSIPPQFSIPGRYASALYMAAVKADKLDAVTNELSQMAGLLKQSDDFREFVSDPTVGQKVKVEGMSSVMDGLGASSTTKNFFALLADNSRLNQVPKILDAFQQLVAEQRGEVQAVVTAAQELTAADVSEITESLKDLLKPGQSLTVSQKVDPAILGGLMVDFEDKHIDLSIRSRIQSIQKAIGEAVV